MDIGVPIKLHEVIDVFIVLLGFSPFKLFLFLKIRFTTSLFGILLLLADNTYNMGNIFCFF